MIRRVIVLLLLVGGALLLEPLRVPTEGVTAPRSLFLFGILLLAADTLGALAADFKLPRLIGYVLAGALLGPSVSNMVPDYVLTDMGMMKNLALGLIGLLAGAELRLKDLQRTWRTVLAVTALQMVLIMVVLVPVLALARPMVPFGTDLAWQPFLLLALLFATMMAVNSPMVVLAVNEEAHARGPLATTTLGIVLVADVAIILVFTVVLSLATTSLGGAGQGAWSIFLHLAAELGGSILAGLIVGGILTLYVRYVRRELVVFAVIVVFATAAAADALNFELLLSLLVAGFLFENMAPVRAEPMTTALEQASTPVFVVFFALTAAELQLSVFTELWPILLIVTVARGAAIVGASRLGGRLGGADEPNRRWGWCGLIPQAGVALGFAAIVSNEHPALGGALQALTVGVIILNTGIGPILYRWALGRAGEIRESGEDQEPEAVITASPMPEGAGLGDLD